MGGTFLVFKFGVQIISTISNLLWSKEVGVSKKYLLFLGFEVALGWSKLTPQFEGNQGMAKIVCSYWCKEVYGLLPVCA